MGNEVARVAAARRRARGGYPARSRVASSTRWRVPTSFAAADLVPVGLPPALLPATEAEALSLPPFGRGLNLLTNAVASTEWFARRWDATQGVFVRLDDQPAVLTDPDPVTTPWLYRWAATEDLVLYGNHVALYGVRLDGSADVDYRTLRPGSLVPVPADLVGIVQDVTPSSTTFLWWNWVIDGVERTWDEVFHVQAGNRSGQVLGRGVLSQYGDWLGTATAAETYSGAYFAGGALPPAVLQAPQLLTQEQGDDLKTAWRLMTSTREPVVLPIGYQLTPLVSDAEKSQLVQSRQWNAQQVAMLLGVPSHKLGLPGPSMTYQNIETADIDFIRDSVDRYALPLSTAMSKWLMPRGTEVAWNYAGRMRTDQKATEEVLAGYVGAGILTVDEARSWIGRGPLAAIGAATSTAAAGQPELTPAEAV